jgi:branched-chain amino acid aminotransferase
MNGKFIPEKEAKISIYDSALMFGDMVFEMTRSFNKKQFRLKEHLERLYAGIKILRIPFKMKIYELEEICYETIKKNDSFFSATDEHRLMVNVSRGPLAIYSEIFDGRLESSIVVADFPLKWTVVGMGRLFDIGINAVVTSQRAIPAYLMDPKIKNRSRIHYQLANIEAAQVKGDNNWALLLDPDGFIAEGTGDNFFIVKQDTIITPEGRNILRGISRDYIFELAKELDLRCIEKNIELYDVYTADEAFMSGTPFCILPVTSLNGVSIGFRKPGKITGLFIDRWGRNVGVDIIAQIKAFNKETENVGYVAGATPYRFE